MDSIVGPFRQSKDFGGRSPRKTFWLFHLFITIVSVVAGAIDMAMGLETMVLGVYGPLTMLSFIIFLTPSLALMIRRLHDIDRTGWWLPLGLLPFVAIVLATRGVPMAGLLSLPALLLVIFWVMDGTRGPNRFGPDPKARVVTVPA